METREAHLGLVVGLGDVEGANILVGYVGELDVLAVGPKTFVIVKAFVDNHGGGEVEVVGQGL